MSTNDWPSSLRKHYGPGPHKSGSEQTVHQNGKGSSGGSAKKDDDKADRSSPDQITAKESFELKERLLAKDGFTYQPVDDSSPVTGYSMAVFPEREQIIPVDEITVGDLYLFMRQNQDKFAEDDRIHFGAWYNEKTESNPNGDNQVYLDLSMVIEDQADAEKQAKELGQLGIYDLASGSTIETMTPDERKKWEEDNERSKTKSIDGREAGHAGPEGSDGNQDVRAANWQDSNGSGTGRSGEDGGSGHGQGWPESLKGILARGRQGLDDERGGGDGSVATKEAEAFPELTEGHTTAFSEDSQSKTAAFLDSVLPEIIDGDGDGFIYDGTMNERPADPAAQEELRKQEEDLEKEASEEKKSHEASSIDLFNGEPESPSGEYTADGRPKSGVAEIAYFLQNRHGRHINTLDGELTEEERDYIVTALFEDTMFALEGDDAFESSRWYENVQGELWGALEKKYPKLSSDPEHKFRFMAGLALLSNGQDINTNMRDASALYEFWDKTGNWDTDHNFGNQTAGFQQTAKLFDSIVEKVGPEKAKELFDKKITARQLADVGYAIMGNKEGGSIANSPFGVGGELADEEVPAFAIFGPKLGSFYNNLNGKTDTVTMDLWFARTMGRITGESVRMSDRQFNDRIKKAEKHIPDLAEDELMGFDKDELLASLEETKQAGKITKESKLYEWSKARQDHYIKSSDPEKGKTSYAEKTDLNRFANLYAKSVDELTMKGPKNGSQRRLYRSLINDTMDRVNQARGVNEGDEDAMTPAGVQAALWFHEKKLYHRLGSPQPDGGSAKTDNYGTAATKLVNGEFKEIEIPWEKNKNKTDQKSSEQTKSLRANGQTSLQKKTSLTDLSESGQKQSPKTTTSTSSQMKSSRSLKRMEAMAMKKAIQGLKIRIEGLKKSVRADGIPVDGDGDGYVFDGTPEERPYTPAEADALLAELTSEAEAQEELAAYHDSVGHPDKYGQNQFVTRQGAPDISEVIVPPGNYAGTGLSGNDPYEAYLRQFSPEALAYKLRRIESVEITPERLAEMTEAGERGYGFGTQHMRIKDALREMGLHSPEQITTAASKIATVEPKLRIDALADRDAIAEVKRLQEVAKQRHTEFTEASDRLKEAQRAVMMQPDNEAARQQVNDADARYKKADDTERNARRIKVSARREYVNGVRSKLLESVNSLEPMKDETKFETLSRLENDIKNHRDLITAIKGMSADDAAELGFASFERMDIRHSIEDSLASAEREYSMTAGLDESEQQFFGFDSGARGEKERTAGLNQYYNEEHDALRSDIDARHDRIDAIENTPANSLDMDAYVALRDEKQALIGSIENDLKRLKYLDTKRNRTSPSRGSRYSKWRDPEALRAVQWTSDYDGDLSTTFDAAGKEFKTTIVGGSQDLPSSVGEHLEDRGIISVEHDDSYHNIGSMMFSDEDGRYSKTGAVGGSGARQVMKGAAITLGSHIAKEQPSVITFTASGKSRKDLYRFLTSRAHEIYDGYTGYGGTDGGVFAIVRDDVKSDFEEAVDLSGYADEYKNLSQEQIDKRSRKSFIEISATEKMMDQVVHELINDGTPYEEPVDADKPSKKAVGMNTFMPERGGAMVLPEYHEKDGVIELLKDIESKKQDITRSLYNIEHAGVKSYGEKMLQKLHDGSEAIKKAMAADMSLPEIIDGDSDGFIYDGSTNERPSDPAAQEELRRRVDQLETKVKQAEQKIEQAATEVTERVELAEGERTLRDVELEGSERFVPEGGAVKQLNDLELIDAYSKAEASEEGTVMAGGEVLRRADVLSELRDRFVLRMERDKPYTKQPVVGANHLHKVLENPSDFIDADGNLSPYNQKVASDSYDIDAMHEGAVDEYNELEKQRTLVRAEIRQLRMDEGAVMRDMDLSDEEHAEKMKVIHEKRDELTKKSTDASMDQSFVMDDVRNRLSEEIAKVQSEALSGVGEGIDEAEAQKRIADRLQSMMIRGEENLGPANRIEEYVNESLNEAARQANNRAAALISKYGGDNDEQQFFGFDTGKRGDDEGTAGLVLHLRDKQAGLVEAIKGVEEGSVEHQELVSNLERVKAGLRANEDYQNMPLSKEDEAIIKDIFADNPSAAFVNVDAGDYAENYDQMPYYKKESTRQKFTDKLKADEENKEAYLEDARMDLVGNVIDLYPEAMREATAAAGISAAEANKIGDQYDGMSYNEAKAFVKENDFLQKLVEVKADDLDADYDSWCDTFVEDVMMGDDQSKQQLYDFAVESGILNVIDDTEGYVEDRFGFDGQTIASLVGAPDDAEVTATVRYTEPNEETGAEGHGMIHVEVMHDDIEEMQRTIKIRDGRLSITHDNFSKNDNAPSGFSTKILARAIPSLQKAGFTGIRTSAAGAGSQEDGEGARGTYTGYYNWARSGFNAELNETMKESLSNVMTDADLDDMKTVLDVMKTKEGRKAWRDYGSGFSAHFDMMEGARSLDVIQRYALEKYRRQDWRPFERNE